MDGPGLSQDCRLPILWYRWPFEDCRSLVNASNLYGLVAVSDGIPWFGSVRQCQYASQEECP